MAPAADDLVISETGFGPLDIKTPATLASLRSVLPQFHVAPRNDTSLEYDIFEGKDRLGYIVTNEDASIFNIHITSGKFRVANHDWRAGAAFQDAKALTACTCWGESPVCFKAGEHVAVAFDRTCLSGDAHALRALDGLIVQRVIWNPAGFGPPTDHDSDDDTPEDDGDSGD